MFRRIFSRLEKSSTTTKNPIAALTNSAIVEKIGKGEIRQYQLDKLLAPDFERAIQVRREAMAQKTENERINTQEKIAAMAMIPYQNYCWDKVFGQNCENPIGYVPIPVGIAGPINMDGVEYYIPMATTEGALIASTHRGVKAINQSGGCVTVITTEGMTRAPVLEVPNLIMARDLRNFCVENFHVVKEAFDSTSRFGRLIDLRIAVVGRKLYIRFKALTGDAMGMNMVSKGCDAALKKLQEHFPEMKVLALSGNFCTDKKSSAINWVEGRGKSVVAEVVVKKEIVETVLKSKVEKMIQLNVDKNLVGSAMAGGVGGFNAQAANIVAAIFIATGQDPAQVVESATCLTYMTKCEKTGGLVMSVTMPSIETGTVGGGTGLDAQKGLLSLVGCQGSNQASPGANAGLLARLVAAGVLSGELSLMSGLAEDHLLSAHLRLNRKPSQ